MIKVIQPLQYAFNGRIFPAVLLASCTLAVLVGTSRDYAMAFDEGFSVKREQVLAQWFAALLHPPQGFTRADVFSREAMERFWPFARKEPDGHPPVYAFIGLAGWYFARNWTDPLTSYRIGPMVLTAVTAGLLYVFLCRRHGRLAALTAAALLVFCRDRSPMLIMLITTCRLPACGS